MLDMILDNLSFYSVNKEIIYLRKKYLSCHKTTYLLFPVAVG